MKRPLIVLASALLSMGSAKAADWYVDAVAGADTNSGTQASPVQTIAKGLHLPKPGDTLHIEPTAIYTAASGTVPMYIASSGAPGGVITIQGDQVNGRRPQILAVNALGIEIAPAQSYLRVTGFDTTTQGSAAYSMTDESCIYIFDGSNHIEVDHNNVHNCGDNGIAARGADYLTIDHNYVANNAQDTATFCDSGIEIYQLRATDQLPGYHNLIEFNRVTGNTNYLYGGAGGCPQPPGASASRLDTDGNGIIIDDSRNTQNSSTAGAYTGSTLVYGNVVWGNGGRGIYAFISDHIAIINNTVWHNNQDPFLSSYASGEIECLQSGDCNVSNNIAVTDGKSTFGGHFALTFEGCTGLPVLGGGNVLWADTGSEASAFYAPTTQYDQVHGSSASVYIGGGILPANRFANPQLVNPSDGIGFTDFHTHFSSPAFGWAQAAFTLPFDIDGSPTPVAPNSGAYQTGEP